MSTFDIVYVSVAGVASITGLVVGIRFLRRWRRDLEHQIDQRIWAGRSSELAAQRRGREQAERMKR